MVICKFFFQGECRFGENCRFEHQFPSGNRGGPAVQGNQTFQHGQHQNQMFAAKPANEVDTNTLITSVHNDMVALEKNGQWLLTCYAPFKEKDLFPGFQDQSFEEVRLGCYEAQKTNTFEQYKQQLQQALLEARTKFKALQTPSKEVIAILKNIYNAPVASDSSNLGTQGSIFGNNPTIGSPFSNNSIFSPNVTQPVNQNSGGLFNQNQPNSMLGQQNVNQNSGGIFAQQNTGNIFAQQNANLFTQSNGQQPANSIFANANKNIFNTATQNTNSLFSNATQQPNLFQTNTPPSMFVPQNNPPQNLFPSGNQNPPQNLFTGANQNQTFASPINNLNQMATQQMGTFNNQVNTEKTQAFQNNPMLPQGASPFSFTPSQNPQFPNQNTGAFQNQNPQISNSILNQNTNSAFNTQPEPSKSIFDNLKGTNGNMFGGGSSTINHNAYSKMEDLSESDINWFKSNDLDISTMPEKPPTYEMCSS